MLTLEQQACNAETLEHILNVQKYINIVVTDLLERGNRHDQSKLKSPEVEKFAEHTAKLKALTYGTPEYEESRRLLGEALTHHYAKNDHHSEHHPKGIRDMNLVQIVEMFCDWKAATLRHNDGNLLKSIDHNAQRYNLSSELVDILKNTARLFE